MGKITHKIKIETKIRYYIYIYLTETVLKNSHKISIVLQMLTAVYENKNKTKHKTDQSNDFNITGLQLFRYFLIISPSLEKL